MKKFKGEIIRTDEYEIEIDESIWTEKDLAEWSKVFWPTVSLEDLAKIVGQAIMRLGSDHGFFEGFGYLNILRSDGSQIIHFGEGLKPIPDEKLCVGITVRIIYEDDDYDNRIEEVKP